MKNLVTVLLLLSSFLANAQTWLEVRTQHADQIVEGQIISQHSFWNEKNDFIFTKNRIQVRSILKGERLSEIEIITKGGQIGNKLIRHDGIMPRIGDTGIFFAKKEHTQFELLSQSFLLYDRLQQKAAAETITFDNPDQVFEKIADLSQQKAQILDEKPYFLQKSNQARTEEVVIESLVPLEISAGTRTKLTINGKGFGEKRGEGNIFFTSNETGGTTRRELIPIFGIGFGTESPELISWSDTKIEVYVPYFAGTGEVAVKNDANEEFRSSEILKVKYAVATVPSFFGFNRPNVPAPNADLVNSNNTGGYTIFVSPEFFQNQQALPMLSEVISTWRCETGVNFELAASQASIDYGFRGLSTISFFSNPTVDLEVFSQYNFCNNGVKEEWRLEEFQIFLNYNNVLRRRLDVKTLLLQALARASQLERVNDSKDLMYYRLNPNEVKTLSQSNKDAAKFITNQSLVVNDCGNKPMILVDNSTCKNVIEKPVARFSAKETAFCGAANVSFLDESKNAVSVSWTFQGGTPATSTERNPVVAYTVAGRYDVTMTVQNPAGNTTETKKAYIVIGKEGELKVDLGGDKTVCQGQIVTLDAGIADAYEWSNGATTQKIDVKISGNYSVVVKKDGCEAKAGTTVSFQGNVDAGTNKIICEGQTIQLQATGGSAYRWLPTTGLSNPTIANPIAKPDKTTVYTVFVNTGSACGEVRDSVKISVEPIPTLTLPDTTYACGENTIFLNASFFEQGTTYEWSTGSKQSFIQVTEQGKYWVKVTNQYGCIVSDTTYIKRLKELKVNAGEDQNICQGEAVQLKATGGAEYFWRPAAGLSNPNIANPIARPTQTTTYILTSFASNCPVSLDSVKITVSPRPTLDLGKDIITCDKEIVLDAKNEGAVYKWSNGATTQKITVKESATYSVEVFPKLCSTSLKDSIKVQFLKLDLGKDTIFSCQNTVSIQSNLDAAEYLWSNGEKTKQITASKSGLYKLTATLKECANKISDSVWIYLPETDILKDSIRICSPQIVLDAKNWSPQSDYTWSNGSKSQFLTVSKEGKYSVTINRKDCNLLIKDSVVVSFSKLDFPDTIRTCKTQILLDAGNRGAKYVWQDKSTKQTFLVKNEGKYYVTVSDTCGKIMKDSVIVLFQKINKTFNGKTLSFCKTPALLNAQNANAQFLWSDNSQKQTLLVEKAGKYWLTITDSCQNKISDTVNVIFESPKLSLRNGKDTLQTCADSLLLDAKNEGAFYLWSDGSKKQTLTVRKTGKYFVQVNSTCEQIVLRDSVFVFFQSVPEPKVILGISPTSGTVSFNNVTTLGQGDNFEWDFGDGTKSTEKNPVHTYQKIGAYKAKLTVKNSCGTRTNEFAVNILVAANEAQATKQILVYPNPSKGVFKLKTIENGGKIKILDVLGREKFVQDFVGTEVDLKLDNLAKGVYLLKIFQENREFTQKLVLE